MKEYRVGIIGATGMVGQRFVTLLAAHPWFRLTAVAASARSAGKTYEEAVRDRWLLKEPIPQAARSLLVQDAQKDREKIAANVDFVFCAVDLPRDDVVQLEESYARLECPVISNNSACRRLDDVPMLLPECNSHHTAVIETQKKRLGTRRGFIAVKPNCSLQSYVPALQPLLKYGPEKVLVVTCQAISGAGRTFDTWPEMIDNVMPLIPGEEEKSQLEPLKIWGSVENGRIVPAKKPDITAQCLRVPVSDGHLATVFASFRQPPEEEEIIAAWERFAGLPQKLRLPSAPKKPVHYLPASDRPQTRLDRDAENGMAVCTGRLRPDSQYDYKFVCLSHNTLRGAAGGAVLAAELLAAQDYL